MLGSREQQRGPPISPKDPALSVPGIRGPQRSQLQRRFAEFPGGACRVAAN